MRHPGRASVQSAADAIPTSAIQFVDHIEEDGPTVFAHACHLGCEGIVSKKSGSVYVSGRTDKWIKVKNPGAPAVSRERAEDWNRSRSWR